MFSALEYNTTKQIATVFDLISIHNSSLSSKSAKERELIKMYSTASTVTRLYAILEGYISNAIADYLDYLSNEVKFETLTDKFKEEYRLGFSNILRKTHHESFKSLNHVDLVNWYHEALSNKFPFKFIAVAFTSSDNNYRLSTIERIFNKIDLKDLKSWISKSNDISNLYPEDTSILEQIESEIKEFVKQRNDASHTSIIDISGPSVLKRYCELINALVVSITAFLRKEVLKILISTNKYVQIGEISEVFSKRNASILLLDPNMKVRKNDKIYVLSNASCYEDKIATIQVANQNTTGIKSKSNSIELGIVLNKLPKRNSKIIKLKDWS